jgi:HD-GYP domain-containing protein (c-di-GMP phosphodiesterase class II)
MRSSIDSVCNLADALQDLLQGKTVMAIDKEVQKFVDMGGRFGVSLGFSEQEIADLQLLIRVHDVGLAWAPAQTIFKKEQLIEDERAEMMQHVLIGSEVAESTPGLHHIAEMVLHHHEWWDGTGYPDGLKHEEIPVACRIQAILDAYIAMTSDRPYRKAMDHSGAVAELVRCGGTQFDPDLVKVFVERVV